MLDQVVCTATLATLGRVVLHLEVGLDKYLCSDKVQKGNNDELWLSSSGTMVIIATHPFCSFMIRSTDASPKAKIVWKLLV